jgi:hypothetical protein
VKIILLQELCYAVHNQESSVVMSEDNETGRIIVASVFTVVGLVIGYMMGEQAQWFEFAGEWSWLCSSALGGLTGYVLNQFRSGRH